MEANVNQERQEERNQGRQEERNQGRQEERNQTEEEQTVVVKLIINEVYYY